VIFEFYGRRARPQHAPSYTIWRKSVIRRESKNEGADKLKIKKAKLKMPPGWRGSNGGGRSVFSAAGGNSFWKNKGRGVGRRIGKSGDVGMTLGYATWSIMSLIGCCAGLPRE
jgi:hypothetical protein